MRQLRVNMGLSCNEFALLIGLTTDNGADMVRKFEASKSDISNVMFNLLRHIDAINSIKASTNDSNILTIIESLKDDR